MNLLIISCVVAFFCCLFLFVFFPNICGLKKNPSLLFSIAAFCTKIINLVFNMRECNLIPVQILTKT